jgi:hypothetical protein
MLRSNFLLLFLLLAKGPSFSQNHSYRIIYDSINQIIDRDYYKAKRIYLEVDKQQGIDPSEKLNFLASALENNDTKYFKREIRKLMKYHGYKFSQYDIGLKGPIKELVMEKGMQAWMFQKSEKLYPIWMKNNPRAFEIKKKIDELYAIDQSRRYFFGSSSDCDSACYAWNSITVMDLDNLHTIIQLCDDSGILPNQYDHGVATLYKWQLIFLHTLKTDKIVEVWEFALPYLEKTYFAGKIDDSFFRIYDQLLSEYYGYQYYGFEKNVPVKDEEHLRDRKEKYSFL